ncbi:MAG: HAMP domain-containing sensor histidine kinase, partial [Mycobacteriales bacterium]
MIDGAPGRARDRDRGWRRLPPVRVVRWAWWRWRRSLQLRVVSSALVISLGVVALFGAFLLARITDGQLEKQRADAESLYTTSVLTTAQDLLIGLSDRSADSVRAVLNNVADKGPSGTHFELTSRAGDAFFLPDEAQDADVPKDLRDKVRNTSNGPKIYRAYSMMTLEGSNQRVPAFVIGSPATSSYDLYMLMPLTSQVETWELVRRSLLAAGIGLALLIALVVLVITRQVVTPVTHAARIAERFAAGEFAERMNVNGEDEMARLAETFNRMAANLQQKIGELQELSRVQRRFVADVSHELRTPLTTVRMAADILYAVRQDFAPEISRSAELLQKELDRFEGLLVDLL